MSRTSRAGKNIIFGIVTKMLALLLGFASRTVFIYFIGEFYLGVSGLFTNILSLLSFAELGFGTAMNFAMYKPVAQGDYEKCAQLTQYFKKVYRLIAFVVLLVGLILLPCLQFLIKDIGSYSLSEIRTYYVLYLLNSVISYFVTYKYCLVNAMEKAYIVNTIEMLINLVTVGIQIVVIVLVKKFIWYLLAQSMVLLLSRIFISLYLNKKVPLLVEKPVAPLSNEDKKSIKTNVKGLIVHNFSSIMIHSTDNLIISSYIGVVLVGYVSNYNLIITSVISFIKIMFDSIVPSFGNLVATESPKDCLSVYRQLDLISSWLYGLVCVIFLVLIPSFITLWIGEGFLIDTNSFLMMIIGYYFLGESSVYTVARNAKGNFNKDKWWALLHAIVNIVVSLIAVQYLGLFGIYIGTVIARMVALFGKPLSTYKFMFEENVTKYFLRIIYYFIVFIVALFVTYSCVFKLLENLTWGTFIASAVISVIVPNIVFLIFYCKMPEFKQVMQRVKNIFGVIINKIRKPRSRNVLDKIDEKSDN